jgi:hypothetical protein
MWLFLCESLFNGGGWGGGVPSYPEKNVCIRLISFASKLSKGYFPHITPIRIHVPDGYDPIMRYESGRHNDPNKYYLCSLRPGVCIDLIKMEYNDLLTGICSRIVTRTSIFRDTYIGITGHYTTAKYLVQYEWEYTVYGIPHAVFECTISISSKIP